MAKNYITGKAELEAPESVKEDESFKEDDKKVYREVYHIDEKNVKGKEKLSRCAGFAKGPASEINANFLQKRVGTKDVSCPIFLVHCFWFILKFRLFL